MVWICVDEYWIGLINWYEYGFKKLNANILVNSMFSNHFGVNWCFFIIESMSINSRFLRIIISTFTVLYNRYNLWSIMTDNEYIIVEDTDKCAHEWSLI